MGVVTTFARLTRLNSYRLDLEYKIQLISSAKMDLTAGVNELIGVGTDLDPESPEVKALEKKKERLYLVEKKLDEKLLRFQTQLKMTEAEIDTVKQTLDKNIQRTYAA